LRFKPIQEQRCHNQIWSVVFSILAAILLNACGSAESTNSGVVPAHEAISGHDDGRIHAGMVIGATPPRSYYEDWDPSNPLTGYEVEILEEIGVRLGREIVYYDVSWTGLFTGLLAGKWDVGASNIFIKKDREAMMDFSEPHLDSDLGMLSSIDAEINSLNDLKGRTFGVDTGSGAEVWLREHMDQYGPYTIQTYNGVPDIFLDVLTGRLDGGISDLSNVDWYVKSHRNRAKRALVLGEAYRVGFAFRPESQLADEFTAAIREMKREGVIAEIYNKFHGAYPEDGNSAYVLYEHKYEPAQ